MQHMARICVGLTVGDGRKTEGNKGQSHKVSVTIKLDMWDNVRVKI